MEEKKIVQGQGFTWKEFSRNSVTPVCVFHFLHWTLYLHKALFSRRNRVIKLIINEQTTTFSFSPSRLDYCGIALLIMGSFVPWLYYGFYCHYQPKVIYLTIVIVLGFFSIVTSLWDKFSTPQLRPVRWVIKICLACILYLISPSL